MPQGENNKRGGMGKKLTWGLKEGKGVIQWKELGREIATYLSSFDYIYATLFATIHTHTLLLYVVISTRLCAFAEYVYSS